MGNTHSITPRKATSWNFYETKDEMSFHKKKAELILSGRTGFAEINGERVLLVNGQIIFLQR